MGDEVFQQGTRTPFLLLSLMGIPELGLEGRLVILETDEEGFAIDAFMNGTCNVMALLNARHLAVQSVRSRGYFGEYANGKTELLPEPHTAVTRAGDAHFSDFVNAVLMSLQFARSANITQETADKFPETELFGNEHRAMFQRAIQVVGNFNEIRFRSLSQSLHATSGGISDLNNGSTGLLYPFTLGAIDTDCKDHPLSDTMLAIKASGTIRCGIVLNRPGFVSSTGGGVEGMDVDFCQAVAASLYRGADLVTAGVTDGYQLLASGELDILAGGTWTLDNDVKEPTTGIGFSFSTPYFYGYSDSEDNFCLATRQDDHDWISFVYWVVMATIYAETNDIGSHSSHGMPEVLVFGSDLKRMFRDAILTVGSYAEIYARNVEPFIPRGNRIGMC
ncbi:extracellular solute-binding protein [Seminavis robusta]|uniref:Extracellular solute-binding protein n=1 Tax=Seminavis robusta TaxID=568900 RepID=A0A9N8DKV6_9STRA|nr:extracellular solute-binding protein [Seminavis robusta]|eukprot:Sro178_g078040.1 extracellular solute-binding protein (391) ;mRNA; f:17870-19209